MAGGGRPRARAEAASWMSRPRAEVVLMAAVLARSSWRSSTDDARDGHGHRLCVEPASQHHPAAYVAAAAHIGAVWRVACVRMNSGQTFLLYASAPIRMSMSSVTQLTAPGFDGVIRVAFLPDQAMEAVLDRYSGCFPTRGQAALSRPFSVAYSWRTEGSGELLMLAHPLHLRLLSKDRGVRVLEDFRN